MEVLKYLAIYLFAVCKCFLDLSLAIEKDMETQWGKEKVRE